MREILFPGGYIQERGVIEKVGEYLSPGWRKIMVVGEEKILSGLKRKICSSLPPKKIIYENFNGECSKEEIERIAEKTRDKGVSFLLGVGGGKCLDAVKAAGKGEKIPVITIPTSSATCAAFSHVSPLYTPQGEYLRTLELGRNPFLVLVDPEIISRAPSRLLSSGMGDTLAKWHEGRTFVEFKWQAHPPPLRIELALELSRKAVKKIKKKGPQAKKDVEKQRCTPQVEEIIEVSIFLTGLITALGGKEYRSLAAHAVNYAMTWLERAKRVSLHGERVAFGIIFQLILEKKESEIPPLLSLYSSLGLLRSLKELGVEKREEKKLAGLIYKRVRTMQKFAFLKGEKEIYRALKEADSWVKGEG